jgi:hypothetical protein
MSISGVLNAVRNSFEGSVLLPFVSHIFWLFEAANSRSASQKFTPFMKPECSLPRSQQSTTGPYPEPD